MFPIRTAKAQRVFSGTCLAYIDEFSNDFVSQSPKRYSRPVLFKFACSTAVYKPFTANVMLGEPIHKVDGYNRDVFEIVRKEPYRLYAQELGDITVGTWLLEEPFELEPRNPFSEEAPRPESQLSDTSSDADKTEVDPASQRVVRFCMMPARSELERNTASLDVRRIMAHVIHMFPDFDVKHPLLKHIPAYALLWAAYVDRRIQAPIIQEPEFITQAFVAAVHENSVRSFSPYGVTDLGYAPPWYCSTTEDRLRKILAEEIERFQHVKSYGHAVAPEGL